MFFCNRLYPTMNSYYERAGEIPGIEFVEVEPSHFDENTGSGMEMEDSNEIQRIIKISPKVRAHTLHSSVKKKIVRIQYYRKNNHEKKPSWYAYDLLSFLGNEIERPAQTDDPELLDEYADAKSEAHEEPETLRSADERSMSPIRQDTVEYLEEALMLPNTAPTIVERISEDNVPNEGSETSCNEEILRIVRSMSKVLNKMANIGMPVDYGRYVNQHLKEYDDEIRQKTVKSILELITAADEEMSNKYPNRSQMPNAYAMVEDQHETKTAPTRLKPKRRKSSKPFIPRITTSNTDRERIVKAYLNGASAKHISDMLNVKIVTVHGILKRYRETGFVWASRRGGNHKKLLSKDAGDSVRNWLKEDSTLSLKQLASKVWEKYRVRASTATVAREVRALRIELRRQKLMMEAKKWKGPITALEESQSNDETVPANDDGSTCIKEDGRSGVSEQCSDDSDVGEKMIIHINGWEQGVEPYKVNSLAIDRPNGNFITTSILPRWKQQQPIADGSHLPQSNQTTEHCTFTLQTLDEPSTIKTVTLSVPKPHSANSLPIDNPGETIVVNAPTTCAHCPCFDQLVSEQRKMIQQYSTIEQTITSGMQQMQETLLSKLKEIERSVKNNKT
uniref:Paired domain-containing protein n=1 Tax=Anopheles minimus TaxID=112268 RepID=A0A182WIJ8_9DIPT